MPPADLSPPPTPAQCRRALFKLFSRIPPLKSKDLTCTPSPGLGGEGKREGKEGDALSPPHSTLPPDSPDHGMLCMDRGGQVDQAQPRMRQRAVLRAGAEPAPWLAAPISAKPGWCNQTPLSPCSGDPPAATEQPWGGPQAPSHTHTSPQAPTQGTPLQTASSEKSFNLRSPCQRAPGLSGFTLSKSWKQRDGPPEGQNQLVLPKTAKPAKNERAQHVSPVSRITQANPNGRGVLIHRRPFQPRLGGFPPLQAS